jgi:multidrug resistance efflux pump
MKKFVLAALVLIIVCASGYVFFLQQPPTAEGQGDAVPTQDIKISAVPAGDAGEVEAVGRLVPAQFDELHFRTSGIIQAVMVKEGQSVAKGDELASLRDEKQMKLAVSQARLEVMNAERALTRLELDAPLLAAQALYDMTQVEKETEKIQKRRTAMDYPRATQEEIDDAYKEYESAEEKFKQVADYFKPAEDIYKAAKAQRNNALSAYNWLISKYTDLEKRESEADLLLHKQRYADLERLYTMYSKGPDPEEAAIAKARIEVAKDQLAVAEAGFEDLVLRAPFSGVVTRLDFQEGQVITANQPLLMLADLSRWNIETEDLTELSVINVKKGAAAQVWIDALPDAAFRGTVIEIKELGETRRGDITYTVVVELADNDPRLRWNMTTPVTIDTD